MKTIKAGFARSAGKLAIALEAGNLAFEAGNLALEVAILAQLFLEAVRLALEFAVRTPCDR
ncbi:hypothetical protein TIFTF001_042776 [Ficus carica]|uniref:Uncharacterized protein n=1 Tax=Ficus carica TaxID=3494 RepID=A0AA88CJL8_FICCA|nr:hypothetical protein TIFTF001_042776 [Ficus carica]